jgi:rubrerythrin
VDAAEVLARAVQKEVEARTLYQGAAARTQNPAGRKLLNELAEEEQRHQRLLEGLSAEGAGTFHPPQGADRKISEYLEPKPLRADSGLQEILIHAMKREEEARAFYQTMARGAEEDEVRSLFQGLAAMEESHKGRLEAFYEDVFLREA